MPQAKNSTSSGLDILLDKPLDHAYYPGQPISGHVQLTTTDDVSIGCITITFFGRSKVKIHQQEGEGESVYRSRANFFSTTIELFRSPHTFKAGSWEWPFLFECPHVADENALRNHDKPLKGTKFKHPKSGYFHGLDDLEATAHITDSTQYDHSLSAGKAQHLPPAMNYFRGSFGRRAYAFVEYALEATMTETEDKRRMFGLRAPKQHTSARIVNFHPGPRQKVIALAEMSVVDNSKQLAMKSSAKQASQSPMLSPSSSTTSYDASNPIKQTSSLPSFLSRLTNRDSVFSSSSSRLPLLVTLHYPRVIQPHHHAPLPFSISIDLDHNTPTSNHNLMTQSLPAITIKSLTLNLICKTRIRAPVWKCEHLDTKTTTISLADLAIINHTIHLSPQSLTRDNPAAATSEFRADYTSSLSNTLDLGRLLNLSLTSIQLSKHIQEPSAIPTFKTYNIMREYGLKWEAILQIAGEMRTERVKGEVPAGEIEVVRCADEMREKLALNYVGGSGGCCGGSKDEAKEGKRRWFSRRGAKTDSTSMSVGGSSMSTSSSTRVADGKDNPFSDDDELDEEEVGEKGMSERKYETREWGINGDEKGLGRYLSGFKHDIS